MTDRIHSLTVVLESDRRDDDLEPLIQAIKQMRGVLDVTAHVSDNTSYMAEIRARRELCERLIAVVNPGMVKK